MLLGEVKSISNVHSKSLQDMKDDIKEIRFVTWQIVNGNCKDKTPRYLSWCAYCLHWESVEDITVAVAHSPIDELFVLITSIRFVPFGHDHCLRRALRDKRKASKLWTCTFSKTLQSDRQTQNVFSWQSLYGRPLEQFVSVVSNCTRKEDHLPSHLTSVRIKQVDHDSYTLFLLCQKRFFLHRWLTRLQLTEHFHRDGHVFLHPLVLQFLKLNHSLIQKETDVRIDEKDFIVFFWNILDVSETSISASSLY